MTRPRRILLTALPALALAVGVAWLAWPQRPAVSPPSGSGIPTATPPVSVPGTSPPSASALEGLSPAEAAQCASRGSELYQSLRCFSCHEGVAGRALTGLTGRYTLSSLVKYLEAPTPPMPTFRVTDDERRDLAVYLLTAPSMR